jgi:hypothetical protein
MLCRLAAGESLSRYFLREMNLYRYSPRSSSPVYATTRPLGVKVMFAHSCFSRPSIVCLTGVEVGSIGSTSTIQPKRYGSFGSSERSKRGSALCQPRGASLSSPTP